MKVVHSAVDDTRMRYVHRCGYCGWRRDATSQVILAPRCDACGCTLEAASPDPPRRPAAARAPAAGRAAKPLAMLLALALLVAAARAGYTAGGTIIAIVAAATMAFLLLPFAQLWSRPTSSGEKAGRQTEM